MTGSRNNGGCPMASSHKCIQVMGIGCREARHLESEWQGDRHWEGCSPWWKGAIGMGAGCLNPTLNCFPHCLLHCHSNEGGGRVTI